MAIAKINGVNQHTIAKYSGTTNETITKLLGSIIWANAFLVFDGVDDKAQFTIDSAFITALCGASGKIGDNISFTFWLKPTWTTSGSGSGFAPKNVFPVYLGRTDSVWDSVRAPYYQLTNSGGTAQNKIWGDVRSSTGGNNKKNDSVAVHSYNSIFACGTSSDDYWDSANPSGGAWVFLAATRAEGKWSLYWNANALTEADVTDNTLNTDNSLARVLSIGYTPQNDTYWPMGIRDVSIWKGALEAENITTLYNSGKFFDHRTAGLTGQVVYYPFHADGADFSGNADNLTVTGGTITSI